MSFQSWKEEFYPVEAETLKKASDLECLQHSLRKWEGLTEENLKKHGLHISLKYLKYLYEDEGELTPFTIDDNSCALCKKHFNPDSYEYCSCETCPLYAVRETTCDDSIGEEILSPYHSFMYNGNPIPMINLLKAAIEKLDPW